MPNNISIYSITHLLSHSPHYTADWDKGTCHWLIAKNDPIAAIHSHILPVNLES